MLGRRDPVGVDRLDVVRVGLAAPAGQEALGDRGRLVHLALRHRRAADAARGLGHEGERHDRYPGQVVARLLVGDVDHLLEAPLGSEHGQRRLQVHARVAGAHRERVRLGRRQAGVVGAVHEQAPDLLEGHLAHELLDVHSAVAESAALLVRLGDLGLEGDDPLETGRDLNQLSHCASFHHPGTRPLRILVPVPEVRLAQAGRRRGRGPAARRSSATGSAGRARDEQSLRASAVRLLGDPDTEFLLAGDPADGRLPAALPPFGLDRDRRLLHRGRVRPRARPRAAVWAARSWRRPSSGRGRAAAPAMEVDTNESNAPALALYGSFGFESGSGASGRPGAAAACRALRISPRPGGGISPPLGLVERPRPGHDHPLPRRSADRPRPGAHPGHARRRDRGRARDGGALPLRALADSAVLRRHPQADPLPGALGARERALGLLLGRHARDRRAQRGLARLPGVAARSPAQRGVERGERAGAPEDVAARAGAPGARARRPGPPPRCSRARRRPPRARRRRRWRPRRGRAGAARWRSAGSGIEEVISNSARWPTIAPRRRRWRPKSDIRLTVASV